MSLSLDDLKIEIDEYHSRIEEVLSGMDAVLGKMDRRLATLEGQFSALAAALSDEPTIIVPGDMGEGLSSQQRPPKNPKGRR